MEVGGKILSNKTLLSSRRLISSKKKKKEAIKNQIEKLEAKKIFKTPLKSIKPLKKSLTSTIHSPTF